MPELPEVQTVVDTLRPAAVGRTVVAVDVHRADVIEPLNIDLAGHLVGRTVADVTRRGKRIVVALDDGHRFYVHLGMTGRLTLDDPATPLPRHTHVVWTLDDGGRFASATRGGSAAASGPARRRGRPHGARAVGAGGPKCWAGN